MILVNELPYANLIKEKLSETYLRALVYVNGFSLDIPAMDIDSVDAVISAKGNLDHDSLYTSPKIDVQLKATSSEITFSDKEEIIYKLPIKNYNELRQNSLTPRILVLFFLPQKKEEWVEHSLENLILKKCAYFYNLKGLPESTNQTNQTIYIPKNNVLTPESIKTLLIKVSKEGDL